MPMRVEKMEKEKKEQIQCDDCDRPLQVQYNAMVTNTMRWLQIQYNDRTYDPYYKLNVKNVRLNLALLASGRSEIEYTKRKDHMI